MGIGTAVGAARFPSGPGREAPETGNINPIACCIHSVLNFKACLNDHLEYIRKAL